MICLASLRHSKRHFRQSVRLRISSVSAHILAFVLLKNCVSSSADFVKQSARTFVCGVSHRHAGSYCNACCFRRPVRGRLPSSCAAVWNLWGPAWGQWGYSARTHAHSLPPAINKFKNTSVTNSVPPLWTHCVLICSVTSSRETMVYSMECLREHL